MSIALETWMKDEFVGRWLLTPDGLADGYVRIVDGNIEELHVGIAPSSSARVLLLPGFVNSHVHLGDTIAYPAPRGTVEEIVGPPNGHKHKVLRTSRDRDKQAAMRSASDLMISSGTILFGDFREEGLSGIRSLKSAIKGRAIGAKIFGRPARGEVTDEELKQILRESDGIGMSSLRDWPYDLLKRLSGEAKATGKLFAMHASETVREDMDLILDLKPDFLVHLCKANNDDIASCVEAEVPIVVCPRSNEFFGLDPRIPRLMDAGAVVALGTDNGMISRPDMIEEMKACFRLSRSGAGLKPAGIVNLATFSGRKVLNAEPKITTEITAQSDLLAVRVQGDDPLLQLVTVSTSENIVGMARGGIFRRTSHWRT